MTRLAFTIIEVLVVVSLIFIVLGLTMPLIVGNPEDRNKDPPHIRREYQEQDIPKDVCYDCLQKIIEHRERR